MRSDQKARVEIAREFAYKDAKGQPAKKQLGTTLTILATKFEGNELDLEVSPEIADLNGMTKLDSGEEQPAFTEHRASCRTTISSGQTVVLGLPANSAKQTIKKRAEGRVTTKTENVTWHTMVFVTALVVDSTSDNPVDAEPPH